jgi:hypothetical protein
VEVYGITGNESRVTAELGWSDPLATDSDDLMIYAILERSLASVEGIRFCGFRAHELLFEVLGHTFLCLHGHQTVDYTLLGQGVQLVDGASAQGLIATFDHDVGAHRGEHLGDAAGGLLCGEGQVDRQAGGREHRLIGLVVQTKALGPDLPAAGGLPHNSHAVQAMGRVVEGSPHKAVAGVVDRELLEAAGNAALGQQLVALALFHRTGQDLGHQIGDLLGQVFDSEQCRCGRLAEIGGVEHQSPDVADGDAHRAIVRSRRASGTSDSG